MAMNHSATAVPDSNGFWECDVWTIGSVCVNAESNGYDALYYNSTGASQYVDFNLVTDSGIRVGDQGAFWASPGSTHTYFFATGNRGCSRVFLYARIAGWHAYSPDDSAAGLCAAP